MHHFAYRDGSLHAEGVDLARIAAEVGTPVYVYSNATIERHYRLFEAAVKKAAPDGKAHVFYAMKANGNLGVLKTLGALGAGIDTVSEGEVRKALAAGIPPEKIVFSGVGKSEQELRFAVEAGIYQVNIESESELDLLSRVAASLGKRQEAVFRVNPDIGAGGPAMGRQPPKPIAVIRRMIEMVTMSCANTVANVPNPKINTLHSAAWRLPAC